MKWQFGNNRRIQLPLPPIARYDESSPVLAWRGDLFTHFMGCRQFGQSNGSAHRARLLNQVVGIVGSARSVHVPRIFLWTSSVNATLPELRAANDSECSATRRTLLQLPDWVVFSRCRPMVRSMQKPSVVSSSVPSPVMLFSFVVMPMPNGDYV
jgi:hypothetical protein